MSARFRLAAASLLGSLLSTGALAQAIDYAALEETIGEPVTTSVTGKPQRASETPASVEIITLEEIRRSPAVDVPGLLKSYAGIDVNRWTEGQSDVAVRGGVRTYNPRLLVLVNGRQVYLDHYGMTDWNLLGVEVGEIQQIEVVRGPATALFGFNAASAVINIITIAPGDTPRISGTAETGSLGHSRLNLVATTALGKAVRLRLSAGHGRDDEREIQGSQQQPGTIENVRRDQVAGTVEISPDAQTRITINSGYAQNEQLELLPSQYASRQRFTVATAGARIDRDTSWGSVTASGYGNWLDTIYGVNTASGNGILGTEYHVKNRIAVVQGSSLIRLGLNNVARIGVEYRDNELRGDLLFSPRIGYSVVSGSAMLDLHPSDRMGLTFAGRVDRLQLSQHGTPLAPSANLASDYQRNFVRGSFNAAVLLQLGTSSQLRINGGLGYQVPSLVDLGVRIPSGTINGLPLLFAGDPSLNPVAAWSGEIGLSHRFSDRLSVTGSLFYNTTSDAIGTPGDLANIQLSLIGGPALVGRLGVAGDFRAFGIEMSARGTVGRGFTWRANYSFTDSEDHLLSYRQIALAPEATTARHKANFELSYRGKRWFATALLRYTSPTRQLGVVNVPQLALLPVDAALAWDQKLGIHIGKSVVFVAGDNLTKASGASGSPIPADRRVRAGITFWL